MKMKMPKEARRNTRSGAFLSRKGRYTSRSMAMPRTAARAEAKKKRALD